VQTCTVITTGQHIMYGLCNRLLYPSLRLLCYTCCRMQLLLVVLYPAAAPDADGTAGAVGASCSHHERWLSYVFTASRLLAKEGD
jgi:hypothetical protein